MKFYQLEDFIAVVEERSFTRAAERLFRTQPTVSLALKRLEEETGVPLLARDGNDWSLTEPGRLMLKYARRLIDLRDEAQRALSEFNDLAAGHVSIAAHESGAQYLLPAPIAAFHKRFPKIRIEMRLCGVTEVEDLVSARLANIGFGVIQREAQSFRKDFLLADPLLLVVPPRHPLTRRGRLSIKDLSQESFVVHHMQTATSERIWRDFHDRGIEFNVIAELWNFEAVKRFVIENCGIAIIPQSVVQPEIDAGELVALPLKDFELIRKVSVVSLDEELLPGAQALHDLLVDWDWKARTEVPKQRSVKQRH